MFKVKRRVYGKVADGRAVLLFAPGAVITDDEARDAGLLAGAPTAKEPARGLVVHSGRPAADDAPQAPRQLARMNLAELRTVCEAEGVDVDGLNLRAEYIEAIELAREAAQEPEGSEAPASDES